MARPALSVAVVGAAFPTKKGPTRHFAIALCKPGDAVELRLEPKNPADERAIAVFNAQGMQMGYLPAERAAWINGMLLNGRVIEAVFQESTPWGAVIRVAFDGEKPFLPESRVEETHRDDPDFWPDPEPPDDF